MTPTALITGADRGLGRALATGLLQRGWQVFAGQYLPEWPELGDLARADPGSLRVLPLDVGSLASVQSAAQAFATQADRLDLLVNNAAVTSRSGPASIREAQDYAEMHRLYDINSLGPLRVVEAFLPFMEPGGMKRLAFVSSEAGSIERCRRTAGFGYTMSKAALNMAVKTLFNDLHPRGYTFRLYHPGWMRTYMRGEKAVEADLEPEESAAAAIPFFINPLADEDRLGMVDYLGQEWPW